MGFIALSWVITGGVVGLVVQIVDRDRRRLHGAVAVLVGVIGAFLGGLISTFTFQTPNPHGNPDAVRLWPGILMSGVGAGFALAFCLCALKSLDSRGPSDYD